MFILIGPGIFHAVQVTKTYKTGECLNLGSPLLKHGVYEVTQESDKKWGGRIYSYYTIQRMSDIPQGQHPQPCMPLNI